jgi:hypothetical protein
VSVKKFFPLYGACRLKNFSEQSINLDSTSLCSGFFLPLSLPPKKVANSYFFPVGKISVAIRPKTGLFV